VPARIDQREGCKIWVNATLATAYGHVPCPVGRSWSSSPPRLSGPPRCTAP